MVISMCDRKLCVVVRVRVGVCVCAVSVGEWRLVINIRLQTRLSARKRFVTNIHRQTHALTHVLFAAVNEQDAQELSAFGFPIEVLTP